MNKVINTLLWCFINDFQPLNSVQYLMCKLHSHIVTLFREVKANLNTLLLYQSGLRVGYLVSGDYDCVSDSYVYICIVTPGGEKSSLDYIVNQLYCCNLTVYSFGVYHNKTIS